MTRLGQELERRVSILERPDANPSSSRHLPRTDVLVLAALTLGSLCAVWIAQAL
jgi:hypothetical protein